MDVDDINELPPCRICGKKLKEVSLFAENIPLEMLMRALPPNVQPESLRHFRCPDKHGGVVLMPRMSDEERELAIKMHEARVMN